ncbi:MAG: hypothetical protein VX938_04345, partial [Myxococcota bacterium]|nr:hypothetical protein [Myxococcota bacterium]
MSAESYSPRRALLWATAVFVVAATSMGVVVLPADAVVTIDGYFHFKISEMIASNGPWVDVSWLPLTVLGDEGPDHHWLWHVLLVPFTWLGQGFMGLKWACVLTAAAVPAFLCLLLHRMGVPWPGLFALLAWSGA